MAHEQGNDKTPAHSQESRRALGAYLAAARIDAGLTQDDVATELELVKQTISAWENGRNLPDALSLRRLSRLYRCSTDALVGVDHQPKWPFSMELQEKVLGLSDEELLRAENVLRGFVDLPRINASDFANIKKLSSGQQGQQPYAGSMEAGAALLKDAEDFSAPEKNERQRVQKPAGRKGGRGA